MKNRAFQGFAIIALSKDKTFCFGAGLSCWKNGSWKACIQELKYISMYSYNTTSNTKYFGSRWCHRVLQNEIHCVAEIWKRESLFINHLWINTTLPRKKQPQELCRGPTPIGVTLKSLCVWCVRWMNYNCCYAYNGQVAEDYVGRPV